MAKFEKVNREKVERIVGRAILDPKFRVRLLNAEHHRKLMEEFEINDAEMEMLSKVKLTDGIPWLFDQGDIDDIMPTACGFQPRSGDVAIG